MRRLTLRLLSLTCAIAPFPAAAQDLQTAIADALDHSPAVEEAAAQEKAAKSSVDRARTEGNPLLRVEGSVATGRIDNDGFFGFTADDVTPLALKATGELPLYAGGRVAAAIDQAKGGLEIARLQTEQTQLQTVVNAVSAYADVLAARKLVARYRKLSDALHEIERQAGLRFQTGEIANTELAQARARRAEGEAGLVQAEGRLTSAEARYERLIGKAPGELGPLPPLPQTPATLDEAQALAGQNSPVLKQAERAVRVGEAGVRAARAEGLPTIGAFAEAARVRDQFFPDYRADSVAVGVRGRWTLWAGGRVLTQTHKADAELSAAEARARGARLAIEGMVIDAWQGLQTANRMAEATSLRSTAANEALRGTQLEAKVGAKPTLAVLDAEREAIEAEASHIETEGMRLVAAYRLNALTGTIAP